MHCTFAQHYAAASETADGLRMVPRLQQLLLNSMTEVAKL